MIGFTYMCNTFLIGAIIVVTEFPTIRHAKWVFLNLIKVLAKVAEIIY